MKANDVNALTELPTVRRLTSRNRVLRQKSSLFERGDDNGKSYETDPFEDLFEGIETSGDDEDEDEDYFSDPDKRERKRAPNPADLSAVQRKLQAFIDRMTEASIGNRLHPRKPKHDPNASFFMPLLFGDDITFNPFQSHQYPYNGALLVREFPIGKSSSSPHKQKPMEEVQSAGDDDGGEVNARDFSDITNTIKKSQQNDAEELLKQLYNTSKDDVSAENWTHLTRMNRVDWEAFFRTQESNTEKESVAPIDTSEWDFLESMATKKANKTLTSGSMSMMLFKSKSSLNMDRSDHGHILSDDTYIDEKSHKITPLPFGKVIQNSIDPDCYLFYQVRELAEIFDMFLFILTFLLFKTLFHISLD